MVATVGAVKLTMFDLHSAAWCNELKNVPQTRVTTAWLVALLGGVATGLKECLSQQYPQDAAVQTWFQPVGCMIQEQLQAALSDSRQLLYCATMLIYLLGRLDTSAAIAAFLSVFPPEATLEV